MKRIVLQKRDSRLYARKADDWTPEITQAAQFNSVLEAVNFARTVKDTGLDVLMDFGNPSLDIRLKVKN